MENMTFFFRLNIHTAYRNYKRQSEIEREKGEWFDYLNVEI